MIDVAYGVAANFPYPQVVIELSSIGTGRFVSGVMAKLDTGANRTLLPRALVDSLALPQSGDAEFEVADGVIVILPLFFVRLSVEGLEPVELLVSSSEREDFILFGRDVLNLYRILLDGPNGRLAISGI